MKRKICMVIGLAFILIYFVRIIYVNKNVKYPISIKYAINEEVPIGRDFVTSLSNSLDGCNILVVDAQKFSYSDFKRLYEFESANVQEGDWILLTEMYIYSKSSINKNYEKIDLMQFTLQDGSYINIPEEELLYILNDTNSSFIPIGNTAEKKIMIPFVIKQTHINLVSNHFDLVITLYPHKKSIKLNYT